MGVVVHSELKGRWDLERMSQVLRVLINNAVRFGENKTVTITASRNGDDALVTVRDQGVGILKEDQEKIFERFERPRTDKSYGGMGLGLFVAKQVIQAHRGTIAVESAPQTGTLFKVRLPLF